MSSSSEMTMAPSSTSEVMKVVRLLEYSILAVVAIVPGTAFGKTSIDFVRFSFAASQDNIQKALDKISKMLK